MDCERRLGTQFLRLCLALSLYVMSPAQAATEFSFDLPAQPMIESLQAIVQTSGVPLRYAPEAVDGLTAPAVKASLDLEAAYSAVLAGSGLRPRFAADGAVVVAPDGAATQALVPVIELPPVDLPGQQLQRQDPAAVRLDTTVVTGTRTEHRYVDSPVEVQLITAQDIADSGAGDLAELLEREGGVHVSRVAGRGNTSIEIQGLSSEHVLILVDGRRVIGRIDGAIDLARLRTANIERVEIVKGPASALYGSDALGGVVNIITRAGGDGGRLTLRGDDDDNREVFGNLGWSAADWTGNLSGGYVDAASFDLDPDTATVDGPDAEGRYFSTHNRWTPGERLRLDARFDYALDDSQRLDGGTAGKLYDVRKRTEELRAALAPRIRFNADSLLSLDAYYTRYYDQYVSEQRGSDDNDVDERTTDQLYTVSAQLDQRLGRHALSLGLEHQYEELEADRLDQTGERDRQAVFVQDELRLLDSRFTLVPGLRYDRDSQFGDQWSPKLSLRYDLGEDWIVRAGYGRGYRAPDFKQLLLRFENAAVGYRVDGNPGLRAERSSGYNLGLSWYAGASSSLSLSVYHNEVDELIEIVQVEAGPPTIYSYRNVSRARLTGADLQTEFRPLSALRLRLGYGWLDAENRDTGAPLSGRAEHRGNAEIRFEQPRYALALRGVWIGAREFAVELDTSGPPTAAGTAEAYALYDLRGEWSGWSWLDLALGIDNLFDEGDPQYLPIQPRSVYLELRKTF